MKNRSNKIKCQTKPLDLFDPISQTWSSCSFNSDCLEGPWVVKEGLGFCWKTTLSSQVWSFENNKYFGFRDFSCKFLYIIISESTTSNGVKHRVQHYPLKSRRQLWHETESGAQDSKHLPPLGFPTVKTTRKTLNSGKMSFTLSRAAKPIELPYNVLIRMLSNKNIYLMLLGCKWYC